MRKLFIAVAFLSTLALDIRAGDPLNGGTLYWENDAFGVGRKSDRFYTQGAKVTVLLSDDVEWWKTPADKFKRTFCKSRLCGKNENDASVSIVVGQNFYTPEDILIAAPQPLDRPWAGWLYTGLSEALVDSRQKIQNYFEVQVGVLGPGAGAQRTQKYIHNDLHFSDRDPQGWDNQLKNEPTLNLLYQYSHRFGNNTRDLVPQGGVMVGTLQSFASIGTTVRVGWHMTGFPIGHIVPAANAIKPSRLPYKYELHFFGGAEHRWVPWNATLQGGFFNSGPEAVGPKRNVSDLRAGISGRIRWLRLTYTVLDRSKEFHVQPGHDAKQRFGSWALSFEPFDKFRD
jgi:lipid A 3-O-deacylase